jgi:ferredoxin
MRGPLPGVIDAARCTRCLLCEAICPDFAITVVDATPSPGGGEGENER